MFSKKIAKGKWNPFYCPKPEFDMVCVESYPKTHALEFSDVIFQRASGHIQHRQQRMSFCTVKRISLTYSWRHHKWAWCKHPVSIPWPYPLWHPLCITQEKVHLYLELSLFELPCRLRYSFSEAPLKTIANKHCIFALDFLNIVLHKTLVFLVEPFVGKGRFSPKGKTVKLPVSPTYQLNINPLLFVSLRSFPVNAVYFAFWSLHGCPMFCYADRKLTP